MYNSKFLNRVGTTFHVIWASERDKERMNEATNKKKMQLKPNLQWLDKTASSASNFSFPFRLVTLRILLFFISHHSLFIVYSLIQ